MQVFCAFIHVHQKTVPRSKNPTTNPIRFNQPTKSDGIGIRRNLSVGFDRPLLLISSFNKLVPSANFRDRSKPIDRFHRIPTLGIRMSVHNPDFVGYLNSHINSIAFRCITFVNTRYHYKISGV